MTTLEALIIIEAFRSSGLLGHYHRHLLEEAHKVIYDAALEYASLREVLDEK